MKTLKMTMAEAVVKFLVNQFIEIDGKKERFIPHVFGIFGHGNVAGLGQAIEKERQLRYFQPKNEQAMVHSAVAFAKTQRGNQCLACTTSVGPGATNMVTGAATATINRLPVLLLPGDIFASRLPNPVLQQLEHPQNPDMSVNDCFKPVSKYWDRINRPEQILLALPEAMRVLTSPSERGAVTICLPEDVQTEAYEYPENFFEPRVWTGEQSQPSEQAIANTVEQIKKSQKPLIVAGGGVHYANANKELAQLSRTTGIPVATTQAGVGAVLSSENSVGAIGVTGTLVANRLAEQADLVINVGTRLSDFTTASKTQFANPEVSFINLNINSMDGHKHGGAPVLGDAKASLQRILSQLGGFKVSQGYQHLVMGLKEEWQNEYNKIVSPETRPEGGGLYQSEVIRVLNDFIDDRSTVVHAAGGIPGDIHKLWKAKSNHDYHSEYGYSCMGYEIAGALGVKLAQPEREVYAFLGDGSYLMLNHEIATAVQEGIKITVVMNNNHGYQCIHGLQKSSGGNSFGNEFRQRDGERLTGDPLPIDYCKNAESLGAKTFNVKTEKELQQALTNARAETGVCFIHIETSPVSNIPSYSWWDVPSVEPPKGESPQRQFYYRGH